MLKKTQKAVDLLAHSGVWIGGFALLLSAFMVSIDVIFRKVFGMTLSGSDEISGYVLAISTSLSFALVLKEKRNIRIDIAYSFLPKKIGVLLDIVSFISLGLIFFLMAKSAFKLTLNSFETSQISVTPLQTPLIIPQSLWFLGFVLALLMWLVIFLQVVKYLIKKDYQGLNALIRTQKLQEEIESSIYNEKNQNSN